MIGEFFGIFFWWSSESSAGGSSLVAFSGNGLVSSARHCNGVKAPARAADSTNARNSLARINAIPPNRGTFPEILIPVAGGVRKATRRDAPQMKADTAHRRLKTRHVINVAEVPRSDKSVRANAITRVGLHRNQKARLAAFVSAALRCAHFRSFVGLTEKAGDQRIELRGGHRLAQQKSLTRVATKLRQKLKI